MSNTGEGTVVFTLTDGRRLEIERVRVDSVSPAAEAPGVIGVEFFDSSRVVHVPFVSYWEFNYPEPLADWERALLEGLECQSDGMVPNPDYHGDPACCPATVPAWTLHHDRDEPPF